MMRIMKRIGLSLLLVLMTASAALAKGPEAVKEAAGKSYMLAYVLVFLIMVLGLVAACRPSRRANRPKMIEKDLEESIRHMTGKAGL